MGALPYGTDFLQQGVWGPAAMGYAAWTYDPACASGGTTLPASGKLYMWQVQVPVAVTVTELYTATGGTGAAGTVAGECWAGLYSAAGELLTAPLDISGKYGGTNQLQYLPVGATVLAAGSYWIGWVMNATTMPALQRGSSAAAGYVNGPLAAGAARFGSAGTGVTALPSSAVPTALDNVSYWAAVG